MVTRDEMARMALRHDTQVAAAFRRALGLGDAPPPRRRARARRRLHPEWRGMLECFRNERSPMDWPGC